jgi:hypothetical protein
MWPNNYFNNQFCDTSRNLRGLGIFGVYFFGVVYFSIFLRDILMNKPKDNDFYPYFSEVNIAK